MTDIVIKNADKNRPNETRVEILKILTLKSLSGNN